MDICTPKILLAEDDADDVMLFREMIGDFDSLLTIAQNGVECIEYASNEAVRYDIFFLDINMPRVNGLSCLKAIRQISSYADVPIIMLSTASDRKTIESAYQYGANLYLTKSINYKQLKHSIQKVVMECLFSKR